MLLLETSDKRMKRKCEINKNEGILHFALSYQHQLPIYFHQYQLRVYCNVGVQAGHQGADGPPEPGPQPAVQHQAVHDPGPRHPEAPHPLLHDHPRVRVPRHRGRAHSNPGD